MCGRFAVYGPASRLTRTFNADFEAIDFKARYNLAPTQHAPVIRADENHQRTVTLFRWGLLPSWAKDPAMANKLINARSETAAEKPSFRTAFRKRRCLIPANGFYEWKQTPSGKQPYFIFRQDGDPMALAGLWEINDQQGVPLYSFTILTTEANETMRLLHQRMPVILEPELWDEWLATDTKPESLQPFLLPANDDTLALHPVDRRVGNVRFDAPDLVEPVSS